MPNKEIKKFIESLSKVLRKNDSKVLSKLRRELLSIQNSVSQEQALFILERQKLASIIKRTNKVTIDIERNKFQKNLNTPCEAFKGNFFDN